MPPLVFRYASGNRRAISWVAIQPVQEPGQALEDPPGEMHTAHEGMHAKMTLRSRQASGWITSGIPAHRRAVSCPPDRRGGRCAPETSHDGPQVGEPNLELEYAHVVDRGLAAKPCISQQQREAVLGDQLLSFTLPPRDLAIHWSYTGYIGRVLY